MAIATKSPEESARRWMEGELAAVREALENPRTRRQYDWGLGFAAGNLRKLTRKANKQAIITLSAALLKEAGLEGADRIVVLPLPEGGALLRRATEEDVCEAHARHAATPRPYFLSKPKPAHSPEVEKRCPQCTLNFRTRQQRRIYCDACRHQRSLMQCRARWNRRGKLTPSYRRKLKGAVLDGASQAKPEESLSLPIQVGRDCASFPFWLPTLRSAPSGP